MKLLLEIFEKSKPLFTEGKLKKLYPLYEAKDTFLFTPAERAAGRTHVRDQIDMKRMMISVVFAMIPCILFGIYNAGHQHNLVNGQPYFPFIANLPHCLPDLVQGLILVLPIIVVSYAVGGICEVIFAIIRNHEINEGFLVSGMLYAMILPPSIPLWQVAIGIAFGVVFGKEVFGGTGMNFLNPALTARAFLFFSYPQYMSGQVWVSKMTDGVKVLEYTIVEKSNQIISGFSGQTPLAVAFEVPSAGSQEGSYQALMNALHAEPFAEVSRNANYSFMNMFLGNIPGSIGETSTLACIIGAVFLLVIGIASWRIMLSMTIGVLLAAFLGKHIAIAIMKDGVTPYYLLPAYYHIVMGGFAFGCVFMATDPVSAATTNVGKWVYGFIIGVIIFIIRVINPAYPEGVMLAILFGNMLSPYIDHIVVKANIKRRLARGR